MTELTNDALFERAQRVIPGGVNSPVRAFRSVGGTPYFVARAEGPHVWDVEGRRYIDLVQSYGAIILGHANPVVVDAVTNAAGDGTSYGAPTAGEVHLAEMITERVPSVEQVRLVSSGTEATMSAIRVARGATGRPKLVKFAGNYHGHSDALLVEGGTAMASLGLPGSAGVTDAAVADTIVAPYNVVPSLDDQVACVIVEPIAANMGLVAPAAGFLEGLRAECDRVGALLIFDEVITGFRVGSGGAQQLLRRQPGPDHLRQGDRRRPADRRLRGSGRPDGGAGAARSRVPGRHPVGEPARHRRRVRRALPAHRRHLRRAHGSSGRVRGRHGRGDQRGRDRRARAVGRNAGRPVLRRRAAGRLRDGQAHRRAGLRRVLPRDARPRRVARAGRL